MWIILAVNIIAFIGIALWLSSYLRSQMRQEAQQNQEQFLKLAKQQFEAEQNKSIGELELKRQSVDSTVSQLKEKLDQYQNLIRKLEDDRAQKYGNLESELKTASVTTAKLQETTNRLNDMLGNVKLRGQWGERMAEDIVRNAGLMEGINYKKQFRLTTAGTSPDYTFFLPNNQIINMDVKFPLDNYLRMVNASDTLEKSRLEKEFLVNVRERVKEIKTRGYISAQDHTLDFVLVFIPNEQVFGYVQEKLPGLIDEALSQKVVLCSPFTLYAMLSVIRQAHENFRYEKDLKNIIKEIDLFLSYYQQTKDRFDEMGKLIHNLETVYEDIKNKNFKRLDTKIRHIDEYKKGQKSLTGSDITATIIEHDSTVP